MMVDSITVPANAHGFAIRLGIAASVVKAASVSHFVQQALPRPVSSTIVSGSDPFSSQRGRTENEGYWLLPRSSLSKTPLRLANSVGLIDSGYTGELIAMVDNVSAEPYVVPSSARLFQIAQASLKPFAKVIVVESLGETYRGNGGFGSTGFTFPSDRTHVPQRDVVQVPVETAIADARFDSSSALSSAATIPRMIFPCQ